jgi:hypothetical protein
MALASSLIWELQPGVGDALNGGAFDPTSGTPGTDYTYGAGATVISWKSSGGSYTNDLASTATTKVLTSAARATALGNTGGFAAADVGNVINISAGTHATTGRYQIMSVDVNGNATLDRACDDGTDMSAATGYLGGAISSIDTIYNVIVAGNFVYLKYGSDSTSAARVLTSGTGLLPIWIIGYYSTRRDIIDGSWDSTHTTNGFLDVSKMPTISVTARLTVGDYNYFVGIIVSGAVTNNYAVYAGNRSIISRCSISNSTVNGGGITGDGVGYLMYDCDLSAVGASGNIVLDQVPTAAYCRIKSSSAGTLLTGLYQSHHTIGCMFYGGFAGQTAIRTVAGGAFMVSNCTFNSIGTCIVHQNSATISHLVITGNQVTNCGTFCANLYSSKIPLFGFNNRIRNTTIPYTNWANVTDTTGYLPGDITTADTDGNEYVNSGTNTNDFHLNAAAAGKGGAIPPFLDTGCWQRQETTGTTGQPVRCNIGRIG